jgi:hypothetical protein
MEEEEEEDKKKIITDDNLGTVSEQKPFSVQQIHVRTTMHHFSCRMRGQNDMNHALFKHVLNVHDNDSCQTLDALIL